MEVYLQILCLYVSFQSQMKAKQTFQKEIRRMMKKKNCHEKHKNKQVNIVEYHVANYVHQTYDFQIRYTYITTICTCNVSQVFDRSNNNLFPLCDGKLLRAIFGSLYRYDQHSVTFCALQRLTSNRHFEIVDVISVWQHGKCRRKKSMLEKKREEGDRDRVTEWEVDAK